MHVLVFEPRYKGHHFVYVQLIVDALLKLGCQVTIGTGNGVPETVEFNAKMAAYRGKIGVETANADKPGSAAMMYRQFAEILARARPDHILVPSGDALVQKCGMMRCLSAQNPMRRIEAESLVLQCRFAYRGNGFRQQIKLAAIRKFVKHSGFSRLYFIDSVAHESLRQIDPGLAAAIGMMPDPLDSAVAPSKTEARRTLGLDENSRYIGTAGSLDERKGIDRLIRAFTLARLPENCRLLIAGIIQPEIKGMLSNMLDPLIRSGRAIHIDRYLNNVDIAAIFSAIDLMCTPYVGHIGPSAVIARSACIGTPVLATDYGWCGTMVPRLGMGWVCDTASDAAFAAALENAAETAMPLVMTPLLRRYFEYLSPANFADTWLIRIRERMSLPPVHVQSWGSVFNDN